MLHRFQLGSPATQQTLRDVSFPVRLKLFVLKLFSVPRGKWVYKANADLKQNRTSNYQSLLFTNKCTSDCLKDYIKIYITIAPTCFGTVITSSGSALLVLATFTLR